MLINKLSRGVKDFDKRIKVRMVTATVLFLIGIGVIMWAIVMGDALAVRDNGWSQGFYLGIGSGQIFAGIMMFLKNYRLLKDPGKKEQQRLTEYDERNLFIRNRAVCITNYIMLFGIYFAILITGYMAPQVTMVLVWVLCSFLLLISIIYFLLSRHYL